MTAPIVEVQGLRKSYGQGEVLRGIDLAIAPGEVFCLLGPNGAGKTTTVEILEGFRDRTAGEVRVVGVDPKGQPLELRRQVGVVLQDSALPGELRVGELLASFRRCYPDPAPMAELLRLVDLDGHERQLVRRLSGGQRRRLDFALALAGNPKLVFLDEPTTGFDPIARRRSWEVIRRLASMGKTIVLTTHYLDEAEALADRVAVIAEGVVVACDTPARLGGRHLGPATVTFEMAHDVAVPVIAGSVIHRRGEQASVVTDDVEQVLRALLSWGAETGHELPALAVSPRSLEETYFELIGQHEGARA